MTSSGPPVHTRLPRRLQDLLHLSYRLRAVLPGEHAHWKAEADRYRRTGQWTPPGETEATSNGS